MGCFDTFVFYSDPPKCAHGHELKSLQTKDLGSLLRMYYVFQGQVFEQDLKAGWGCQAFPATSTFTPSLSGNMLVVRTTESFRAAELRQREISIYTHCDQCDPVVTENEAASWSGGVSETQPWCEFLLTVEGNKIKEICPYRVESREDVKKKLKETGTVVLPDDDRVAKRVIRDHREKYGEV